MQSSTPYAKLTQHVMRRDLWVRLQQYIPAQVSRTQSLHVVNKAPVLKTVATIIVECAP